MSDQSKYLYREFKSHWNCLEWTWNKRKRSEYGFAGFVRGPIVSFIYLGPIELAVWHGR